MYVVMMADECDQSGDFLALDVPGKDAAHAIESRP